MIQGKTHIENNCSMFCDESGQSSLDSEHI